MTSNANTSGLSDACAQEEADTLASKLTNAEIIAASWKDRATAAEARADRLAEIARLLDECIWFNPDTQNFEVNHDGSVEKARAALQQETRP